MKKLRGECCWGIEKFSCCCTAFSQMTTTQSSNKENEEVSNSLNSNKCAANYFIFLSLMFMCCRRSRHRSAQNWHSLHIFHHSHRRLSLMNASGCLNVKFSSSPTDDVLMMLVGTNWNCWKTVSLCLFRGFSTVFPLFHSLSTQNTISTLEVSHFLSI